MRLDIACSHIVDCEHKTAPIDVHGDYFAVGTPAMRDHLINYGGARRISRETFEAWTRRLAPKSGDLLLAREAPVGPVVRIPSAENVAPGQRTVLLRPDPDVTSSEFLYYLLRSPLMQTELLVKADGSTVHHLNVADIRSLDVTLPPLAEQQTIAEVLGALDDKIAANSHLAATADEVYQQQFGQLARRADSRPLLSTLVTTQYGLTASASTSDGPRLIRVTDINKAPWINWNTVPSVDADATTIAQYLVRTGDVVVARMADPGKPAIIDPGHPDAVFASYLVRLRPVEAHLGAYVYGFLRSPEYRRYVDATSQGTVQKNINARLLVDVAIPLPPADLLLKFAEQARSLRALISAAMTENRTLAATRDALLPKLMSGVLRVKDAETIVEKAGA